MGSARSGGSMTWRQCSTPVSAAGWCMRRTRHCIPRFPAQAASRPFATMASANSRRTAVPTCRARLLLNRTFFVTASHVTREFAQGERSEDYHLHLVELLTRNKTVLSADSIWVRLVAICAFCRWLVKTGILSTDATTGLERPIIGRRLPRAVAVHFHREVPEQVLRMPRLELRTGLIDRAIVETI